MNTKLLIATIPFLFAGLVVGCEEQPNGLNTPSLDGDQTPGTVGNRDDNDDPTDDQDNSKGDYSGDEDNTFDHADSLGGAHKDPFEVLSQRQEEGPPEIRTRLHSCQKLQLATIASMLTVFGVDLNATGSPKTAGQIFNEGRDALGGPNYTSRKSEALTWTNSGATKLQDIFVQAAPEIIAAMPNLAQCQIDGVGVQMFDENDECNEAAVSCLIGRLATEEHLAICNQAVQSASTLEKGKAMAVAAMLAGAHTCQ